MPDEYPEVPTVMIPNPDFHAAFGGVAGAAPMVAVKLGAVLLPPEAKRLVPRFKGAFAAHAAASPPPPSHDWHTKGAAAIRRMYANDRYGDCVIADLYHDIGIGSGNDAGACVTVSDDEVVQTYFRLSARPGRDVGCIPADVLAAYLRQGVPVNGVTHKLDGFVAIDWRDPTEVKVALRAFGTLRLAIALPQEWANNEREWVTPQSASRSVGGHMVTVVSYDERGLTIGTWGGTRFMPWSVFTSLDRDTELYATLHASWYNADHLSPLGIDVTKLKAALDVLKDGGLPDLEPTPPAPVPPPTPPVPPAPPEPPMPHVPLAITLRGSFPAGSFGGSREVTITGTAVPAAAAAAGWADVCGAAPVAAVNPVVVLQDLFAVYAAYQTGDWNAVAAAVKKLLADLGVKLPVTAAGGDAGAGITPEQIAAIVQVILKIVSIFKK